MRLNAVRIESNRIAQPSPTDVDLDALPSVPHPKRGCTKSQASGNVDADALDVGSGFSFEAWRARQEALLGQLALQHQHVTQLWEMNKTANTSDCISGSTRSGISVKQRADMRKPASKKADIAVTAVSRGSESNLGVENVAVEKVAAEQVTLNVEVDVDAAIASKYGEDDIVSAAASSEDGGEAVFKTMSEQMAAAARQKSAPAIRISKNMKAAGTKLLKMVGEKVSGRKDRSIRGKSVTDRGSMFSVGQSAPTHFLSMLKKKPSILKRANFNGLELVCVGLVVVYTVTIAWSVQYHALYGQEAPWVPMANLIFCIFFSAELILRLGVERREFCSRDVMLWNFLDAVALACMLLEEAFESLNTGTLYMLRLLRFFRLVRLLRVIRMMRLLTLCRQGRLFLLTLMRAGDLIFWMVMIFGLSAFVAGLIFAEGALERCAKGINAEHALCKRFGTLWTSWFTVVQAMTGAILWGTLADSLGELDGLYVALFAAFSIFTVLVGVNIITGIFVKDVRDVDKQEGVETFYYDEIREREGYVTKIRTVFEELDLNDSGTISKDELIHAFTHASMIALLASMSMDSHAAESLFDLLDADKSGQVNLPEFVVGCLKCRGRAKALDIQMLLKEVSNVRKAVSDVKDDVQILRSLTLSPSPDDRTFQARNSASSDALPKRGSYASSSRDSVSSASLERGRGMSLGDLNMNEAAKVLTQRAGSDLKDTPLRSIENAAQRAMLLSELAHVSSLINSLCNDEMWRDPLSGKTLKPRNVNLYQLDFYLLGPRTAPDLITLTGLNVTEYYEYAAIRQIDPKSGRLIAEGIIHERVEETSVRIQLVKGRFQSIKMGGEAQVYVDDDECGIPHDVISQGSVSYKELVSSTPTDPAWFCCHWWGEPVAIFAECCKVHAKRRNISGKQASYWICAYANRQHELAEDITEDPEKSSFREAMKLSEGMLLVLDSNATPFQRIWCDFELFSNVNDPDHKLDIITMREKPRLLTSDHLPEEELLDKCNRERKFPLELLGKGLLINLQEGRASVQTDKNNILTSIGRNRQTGVFEQGLLESNLDFANRRLRAHFALAAWPQAVVQNSVHKFPVPIDADASKNRGADPYMNLAEILQADYEREFIEMTFGGLDVKDSDVGFIANGLPPNLKDIKLSFESCHQITDRGIALLSQAICGPILRENLRRLQVDFMGCAELTDAGVSFLATSLASLSQLEGLNVNFALCNQLTIEGVKKLADNLPPSVTQLCANFTGTTVGKTFRSARELKAACGQGLIANARRYVLG